VRDVAAQNAVRFKAMTLVILSVFVCLCAQDAHAQNPLMGRYNGQGQVPRELMRASASRAAEQAGRYGSEFAIGQKFSMPPLPGEQAFSDSAQESENYQVEKGGQLPDYGPNSREVDNISLPPLVGLRQVLDSEVTKKLLKDLTVAKANVLMQTYMMVENGAATGFMGGMGIGSDLMSNMLQAQDAQMKMLDVVDDTGRAKEAYVRRVAHLLREGDNKNIWPAAIYMASGESGKKPNEPEMKDLKDGSTPYNFQHVPHSGKDTDPNSVNIRLLSDLIFIPGQANGGGSILGGGSKPYSNDKLDELKQEFVKLVGDTKLEIKDPTQLARKIEYSYMPPRQDEDGKRRGVAAVNWEEVKVVWESIHNILADRCEWAKKNPNSSAEIGKKKTFCSTKDAVQKTDFGNPWELSSSPDIPMTCNLAEQLYTYIEKNAGRTLDCGKDIRLTPNEIPSDGDASSGDNFNDCSGTNGCERKRVVLNLAFVIARSRTLHTYQTLYTISKRFAVQPEVNELVDLQFARTLSGMNIQTELVANRERYADFLDYFSRLSKGQTGGGNSLRPGSNSLPEAQVVGVSPGGAK
jgi:hypothetical protein